MPGVDWTEAYGNNSGSDLSETEEVAPLIYINVESHYETIVRRLKRGMEGIPRFYCRTLSVHRTQPISALKERIAREFGGDPHRMEFFAGSRRERRIRMQGGHFRGRFINDDQTWADFRYRNINRVYLWYRHDVEA